MRLLTANDLFASDQVKLDENWEGRLVQDLSIDS